MRTLTSVRSATSVLLDLELHIKASDQSTTWIFNRDQIESYPKIDWEIDFAGGFGRSSNYDVTLVSSIGFLNTNINKLNRAEAFLKVFVNSDNFTPHYGRVRGFERNASNPDVFKLKVYDNFIDGNVKIPQEAIVDSYSTPHPEVLNVDMGYPLYYGKHLRPVYFTAINCDVSVLLGPRNVSSANHSYQNISGIWTSAKIDEDTFQYNGVWNQQSGSDNLINPASGFNYEIFSPSRGWGNLWSFGSPIPKAGFIEDRQGVPYKGNMQIITNHSSSYVFNCAFGLSVANDNIKRVSTMNYVFHVHSLHYPTQGNVAIRAVNPNDSYIIKTDSGTNVSCGIVSLPDTLDYMSPEYENEFLGTFTTYTSSNYSSRAFITCSLDFNFTVKSERYKNYSIYYTPAPYALEVAISENPNGIIKDILDQTSFNYIQAQNSSSQTDTSAYRFQCLFAERQPLSDIFQEFGELTGTCYWIQDSGFIGMRTYQESATASNSIDYTIQPGDFREDSVVIRDNPIGFIFYQTKKASQIKFKYDYSYRDAIYESVMVADRNNNSFCNSMYAAGVIEEETIGTPYVLITTTASLCLTNYVRRLTTDDNIVEASLPARFMGLELADILEIHHPALPNSSDLYQVTKVKPNYETGDVSFTANKIKNL